MHPLCSIRDMPLIDGFCVRGEWRPGRKRKAALKSLRVLPGWRRLEDMSAIAMAAELQSLSASQFQ